MASIAAGLGLPHAAGAQQRPPMNELAPTGKLRVGVAVGPTPGAGNVARDPSGAYRGIAVPKSTPVAIRKRISEIFAKLNQDPKMRAAVENLGFAPVDIPYEEMAKFLEEKRKEYIKLAKEAGIVPPPPSRKWMQCSSAARRRSPASRWRAPPGSASSGERVSGWTPLMWKRPRRRASP
mgnify:CR=1 FL=1